MRILLGFIMSLAIVGAAAAQNTGGVFPPGFGPDHRSAQYRITVDPDNGDWANRLHYQQSLNDSMVWRVVGQTRKTATSDVDFDFLQAELFWRLTPRDKAFQTGLRFDARLRDGNRPNQIGVNWSNQWTLSESWRVRAVGLSALQLESNRNNDVSLQVRGQLARKLNSGVTVGGEVYSPLGDTGDIKILKGTSASVGPFISVPVGGKRSLQVSTLFGVTRRARNTELRLWLTQGF